MEAGEVTRQGKAGLGSGVALLFGAGLVLLPLLVETSIPLAVYAIAAILVVGLAAVGMIRRQAWGAFVFGWAMVLVAVAAALALFLSGFNPSPYASRDPDPSFNPVKLLVLVILPVAIGAAVLAFRFGRSLRRSEFRPPDP